MRPIPRTARPAIFAFSTARWKPSASPWRKTRGPAPSRPVDLSKNPPSPGGRGDSLTSPRPVDNYREDSKLRAIRLQGGGGGREEQAAGATGLLLLGLWRPEAGPGPALYPLRSLPRRSQRSAPAGHRLRPGPARGPDPGG